jgi:hypothetical protein
MSQPIKAGDVCRVIGGLGRGKSPNLGKTVTVGMRQYGALGGDHSKYGPVHRCTGDGVCQLGDGGEYVVTGWADFPIAWLEKIDPIKTSQSESKTAEISE